MSTNGQAIVSPTASVSMSTSTVSTRVLFPREVSAGVIEGYVVTPHHINLYRQTLGQHHSTVSKFHIFSPDDHSTSAHLSHCHMQVQSVQDRSAVEEQKKTFDEQSYDRVLAEELNITAQMIKYRRKALGYKKTRQHGCSPRLCDAQKRELEDKLTSHMLGGYPIPYKELAFRYRVSTQAIGYHKKQVVKRLGNGAKSRIQCR